MGCRVEVQGKVVMKYVRGFRVQGMARALTCNLEAQVLREEGKTNSKQLCS